MNFVIRFAPVDAERFLKAYQKDFQPANTAAIRGIVKKDGVTMTLYTTNTLMIQGPHAATVAQQLETTFSVKATSPTQVSSTNQDFFIPSIGSDESGVGDYFGPLVVCATYVDANDEKWLKTLGVKDSKQLRAVDIDKLAMALTQTLPYTLLVLDNPTYNHLISQGFNGHKLKAHLHAQCHKQLIKKIDKKPPIIVDQFCSRKLYENYVKDFDNPPKVTRFETKADSRYASVAAASIIARHIYVKRLGELGKNHHTVLEKGASARVDAQAAHLIETYGFDILNAVAKVHFKTTEKAQSIQAANRAFVQQNSRKAKSND